MKKSRIINISLISIISIKLHFCFLLCSVGCCSHCLFTLVLLLLVHLLWFHYNPLTAIHPHLHRNHTQTHYYCINLRSHSHCCIIAACVGSCHQVLINWSLAQMSAHVVDNPSTVTACDCFQQLHKVNLQLKSVHWLSFQNGDDWLQFVIVHCCSMTDEDIMTRQGCFSSLGMHIMNSISSSILVEGE